MHRPSPFTMLLMGLLAIGIGLAGAQQSQPQPQQQPPAQQTQSQQDPPKKADPISPASRLAAAKTAFITRSGNTDIPYNVISSGLEGWGRFTLVNSPEKADIIVDVMGVSSEGGEIKVSSSTRPSRETGRMEQTSGATKQLSSSAEVRLTVYDAKTKVSLWLGIEHPKSALKKNDRENNLVEAAERLLSKFHDRLEPPSKL